MEPPLGTQTSSDGSGLLYLEQIKGGSIAVFSVGTQPSQKRGCGVSTALAIRSSKVTERSQAHHGSSAPFDVGGDTRGEYPNSRR
jgi:hypothetical protein